ncbi:PKD domain-containing protein [bacterium]|nr:PKD domain-containing protein [bacterium]
MSRSAFAPCRWASLSAALLLCLLGLTVQSCGGSSTGLQPAGEDMPGSIDGPAETPRAVPLEESQFGGFAALPAPASLPRAASAVDPAFYAPGGYGYHELPYANVLSENQAAVFEPDHEDGQDGISGMAFACYQLHTRGLDNGESSGTIFLHWDADPLHPYNIMVALANHQKNRWDLFNYGTLIDYGLDIKNSGSSYEDINGTITLAVLVTGHGAVTLKGVLFGDPIFNCGLSAFPVSGEGSLDTLFNPYIDIQGDELDNMDVDFEGDGSWDVIYVEDFDKNHSYTSPGIYKPRLRLRTVRGYSFEMETTVYVTHPNNIGPTALLQASVQNGPAPLSVELDGSASFDDDRPDSQIIKVEWDLDGDGYFETNSGAQLLASTVLTRAGISKLALRVTDDDLATSTASVNITVSGGWVSTVIPGSQAADYSGIDMRLMTASGKPALVYTPDNSINKMQYVPALAADGSSWDQHHFVLVEDGTQQGASLCEVDGHPALAYNRYGGTPFYSLRYIRANSADGSSWPSSSVQLADFGIGYAALEVVDGRPAVAFSSTQSEAGVHWFIANDADGGSWSPSLKLSSTKYVNSVGKPTILAEPGQPARVIVGVDDNTVNARTSLFTATDMSAGSFGPAEKLWGNYSDRQSLMLHGGQYMFLLRGGYPAYNGVNFMALTDFENLDASYAIPKDTERHSGDTVQLACIDGIPIMIYTHIVFISGTGESELVMRIADSPDAVSWGDPLTVSGLEEALQHGEMLTTSEGLPLLVCSDDKNNQLLALRWQMP